MASAHDHRHRITPSHRHVIARRDDPVGIRRQTIAFRIGTCGEDPGYGFAVEEGYRYAELEAKPQADGKKPVRGLQAIQHQVVGNC